MYDTPFLHSYVTCQGNPVSKAIVILRKSKRGNVRGGGKWVASNAVCYSRNEKCFLFILCRVRGSNLPLQKCMDE